MKQLLTKRSSNVLVISSVLCVIALACYVIFLNPVPDYYREQQNDPFTYLSLAKSLNVGQGYPTKHWMPGFPVLLAGWIFVLGQNFAILKLCMVATAILLFAACYLYYRQLVSHNEAFLLCLLVAVVPVIFDYSHKLMSEIPCVAFTMMGLAVMERLLRASGQSLKSKVAWTLVGAFGCSVSVLMRGNALAIAPALLAAGVSSNWSGKRYNLPCIVGATTIVIIFGLWSVRNHFVEFSGIHNVTYLQEVQATDIGALWKAGGFKPGVERANAAKLLSRVCKNVIWYHTYNAADCLLPGARALREVRIPFCGAAFALILEVPFVLGFVRLFRLSIAGAVYLMMSVMLVLVYPTGGAQRMLVPSVPVLVIAGYLGVRTLLGKQGAFGWLVSAVSVGIVTCAVSGQMQKDHPYSFDEFADFVAVLEIANDRYVGSRTVLVSSHAEVVNALSRARSRDFGNAINGLRAGEVESFLVVESRFEAFEPTNSALPVDLDRTLLETHGDARLWRVRRVSELR